MTPETILGAIALIFGPSGAAFVAVKYSLNGTRDSVRRIEANVKEVSAKVDVLSEGHSRIREDVARLKGQLGAS